VEVDHALPPVVIPGRILNELYAHALETLPEECCGLILGTAEDRFRRPLRCHNVMTQLHQSEPATYPRDGREAFWMHAPDHLRAREQAAEAGEEITAVYHSHVGVGAYLSDEDLRYAEHEFFPFPDADHIVIAVRELERKVDAVALFRREGIGHPFRGRAVLPDSGA
jgi:proteasome lid subunit RPN8/RPN11